MATDYTVWKPLSTDDSIATHCTTYPGLAEQVRHTWQATASFSELKWTLFGSLHVHGKMALLLPQIPEQFQLQTLFSFPKHTFGKRQKRNFSGQKVVIVINLGFLVSVAIICS